jgi:hypothetical protein
MFFGLGNLKLMYEPVDLVLLNFKRNLFLRGLRNGPKRVGFAIDRRIRL